MSGFLQIFIDWLQMLGTIVPLPVFVVLGALIEEIIAPIPSPFVMTAAGSIAAAQHQPIWMLGVLALLGAAGKTFGSYVLYVLADKIENLLGSRLGKLIGISHEEIESIGKVLNHGWRDDFLIFALRAIPIVPTAPVSLVAGLIKVNLKTYLTATFVGIVVRNLIYLYLGYTSLGALESLNHGFDSFEKIGTLAFVALMGAAVIYFYWLRRTGKGLALFQKSSSKSKASKS
jgi:membrane protein DedA with SNARE-associated domain